MNAEKQVAATNTNAVASVTPMHMLQIAVEQGADLDKLEKLMALQERWEANEAKKAFVRAMTAFKAEPIEIVKDKHVSYTTTKGTTEYKHATLSSVVDAASPVLSKYGLSHNWKTSQDNGIITVSCVITHELGHSESTSLSAAADASGGKNSIQAVSSTVSYLERYTFLAATGLTTKDQDDDAQSAEPLETISLQQVADLEALIEEVGSDKAAFMKYCKVSSLDEILDKNYRFAVAALEAKRGK